MLEPRIAAAYDAWRAQPGLPEDLAAELASIQGDEEAITDRFYRELAFGTGGLRGVIRAGTNRMNVYSIRKATQGLADYLNASGLPQKAAIGYDSLIKSDVFARETACVLAANGITAYLYPRLEPTPALSWAVRYYGCGAGVCGTAVPDGKGGYRLITGNEMGIILLDYICRTRIARGTMPARPVAVTTIVSTDMATPVAAKYGVELRRTLTGFKFIGEQIGLLEAAGEADRYIFGFEESYGYLSGAHVRDKDAVNATLLVCEAAAWYAQQGMTLLDAIEKLYAEFGCYRNRLESFAFEGEKGMHTMQALMAGLRAQPPAQIGGLQVTSVVDYNAEGTGLPAADVLEFRLEGGAKLMVRPSGTEPKIKVYLSAVAPDEAGADQINETLAQAAAKMLQG